MDLVSILFYLLFIFAFFHCSNNHQYFNYSVTLPKKIFKHINITYSTDFKWHLYTIVSIASLIEHSSNNSIWYNIYILVLPNFSIISKHRLEKLSKYRFSIFIITVNPIFQIINRPKTKLLRLFLPEILPNVKMIIHLDSDTYIFKDLDGLFSIDMNNLLIRGILDFDFYGEMKKFGITKIDRYINSGVILMNLDEMRKEHFIEKVSNFIFKNGSNLVLNDQPIINIIFYKKCDLLPLQYGFHNWFCNENLFKKFFRASYFYKYYSVEHVHKIIYNLTIVHFMAKPWKYNGSSPYSREWAMTALATDYRKEICDLCPWILNFTKL